MPSDPPPVTRRETAAHRELKRLSLIWAQSHGFRVAAAEVSLPNHRVRMDVAAYKPVKTRAPRLDAQRKTQKLVWRATLGVTAVFECKASKADFRRDARSIQATVDGLSALRARKIQIEHELHLHYPSIRNGDSLFQEYETLNFERPGYERYVQVVEEIRRLSARLYGNTKFDRLTRYGAANLYYLVIEPGVASRQELPAGWGLLTREAPGLKLLEKPQWHDTPEEDRLAFFQRISMAATRSVNREHGVEYTDFLPSGEAY